MINLCLCSPRRSAGYRVKWPGDFLPIKFLFMLIEIQDNNTNETGYYKVWFKTGKGKECRRCSEAFVNSLLNMRQKEDFFMGRYKFKITSLSDIAALVTSDPYKAIKHHAEI